jgi:hypothetical protein
VENLLRTKENMEMTENPLEKVTAETPDQFGLRLEYWSSHELEHALERAEPSVPRNENDMTPSLIVREDAKRSKE